MGSEKEKSKQETPNKQTKPQKALSMVSTSPVQMALQHSIQRSLQAALGTGRSLVMCGVCRQWLVSRAVASCGGTCGLEIQGGLHTFYVYICICTHCIYSVYM